MQFENKVTLPEKIYGLRIHAILKHVIGGPNAAWPGINYYHDYIWINPDIIQPPEKEITDENPCPFSQKAPNSPAVIKISGWKKGFASIIGFDYKGNTIFEEDLNELFNSGRCDKNKPIYLTMPGLKQYKSNSNDFVYDYDYKHLSYIHIQNLTSNNIIIDFIFQKDNSSTSLITAKVGEASNFDITKFVINSIPERTVENYDVKCRADLKVGEVEVKVDPKLSEVDFSVSTPTSTASVRGTHFLVSHDNKTNITTIKVFDGVVLVTKKSNGEKVYLKKGESAKIPLVSYDNHNSNDNLNISTTQYLGCYRDQGDPQGLTGRDLNGFIFHSNNMTPQMCINLCAQKGFKYAGVQYSSYCFCGNSYGKYGVANNCNMKCSGDQNQICGGTWANSIYLATNITSPETNINGKTNLIKNGSFELGPQHVGSWLTLSKGSNKINNWAITNGSIDLIENYWQSSNGKRSIDLCGSTCGAISQNINTVPGATYQLTFDLAGNPDNQGIKYLKVIAGSISKTFQFNTTGKNKRNMGWVKKSLTFTATSNITNISFIALDNNPSAWGPAIDNVKIVRISNINTSNNINNPALTTINVAGSWDTNFGKMNLIQRGNTVTGSYTHDKGRITGTISGNILIGRWSEYPSYKPPRDAGDLQFVFSKDGTKFTGKWRYGFGGNTWDGTLNGTKISTNSANPKNTNLDNYLKLF